MKFFINDFFSVELDISYSATLHKMWCSEEVFKLFDYITKYAHSRYN